MESTHCTNSTGRRLHRCTGLSIAEQHLPPHRERTKLPPWQALSNKACYFDADDDDDDDDDDDNDDDDDYDDDKWPNPSQKG